MSRYSGCESAALVQGRLSLCKSKYAVRGEYWTSLIIYIKWFMIARDP